MAAAKGPVRASKAGLFSTAVVVLLTATGWGYWGFPNHGDAAEQRAQRLVEEGRRTFRYDTFGDETFWGDTLRLHEAIAGEANGGQGPASARARRSPSA